MLKILPSFFSAFIEQSTYQCKPCHALIVIASGPATNKMNPGFQFCSYSKFLGLVCGRHHFSVNRYVCRVMGAVSPAATLWSTFNATEIHLSHTFIEALALADSTLSQFSISFTRSSLVDVSPAMLLFWFFSSMLETAHLNTAFQKVCILLWSQTASARKVQDRD